MANTEGTHDSPVTADERLVRIGTKYQATPDTVADGRAWAIAEIARSASA